MVVLLCSQIVFVEKKKLSKELTVKSLKLDSESDGKMAHSAQMFNYQMQKIKLLEEEYDGIVECEL